MTIEEMEHKVVAILGKYNPRKIGIFGSYARGEAKPGSDLDLLTEQAISPYLIDTIKSETKVLYQ